jgi:hypothetical protein
MKLESQYHLHPQPYHTGIYQKSGVGRDRGRERKREDLCLVGYGVENGLNSHRKYALYLIWRSKFSESR